MNTILKFALTLIGWVISAHAAAQVTFYEHDDYQGRSFSTQRAVPDFAQFGFNDRASSAVVRGKRSDRWEVCEDSVFSGRCVVLRPGEYPSLSAMGLNDRVSSVRSVDRNARVDDDRYAPAVPPADAAQIVFYEHESFEGRSFATSTTVNDFRVNGFNDRASSILVRGGRSDRWEVCEDGGFRGRCVVLRPGEYPSLTALGLNERISSVRSLDRNARVEDDRYASALPPADAGQIVLYENEAFEGRSFSASTTVDDLRDSGFNDRASSILVRGGRSDRWEVCEDGGFRGRCVVLRPGQYPSLTAMGLNDRVSSARVVDRDAGIEDDRYAPLPMVSRDFGRRNDERLYEAEIVAVRAVVDNDGRRCWIDSAQADQERDGRGINVPGALIGAVVGGILGHQVGGGTGKNVATGIGVLAGAAVGSQVGGSRGRQEGRNDDRNERSQQVVTTQNVPRCPRSFGSARPDYWDVTYRFRGQEHRVQMTTPPGRTVTVNEQGEPRA
ncbi:MAG: beta/gamma crystallin-related protein [Burkholderiaceae bacterium]|nr:beta/gamma crystallin-related protein [Burkholderiaceae bacterium]